MHAFNHFKLLSPAAPHLCLGVALAVVLCARSAAAEPTPSTSATAATVNGKPIYAGDVQQQVQLVLRGRKADAEALKLLQAQALDQLISRQLILGFLAEKKLAANDREIEVEIDRIRKRFAVTGQTLDEHLKKTNQDLDALKRTLAWQISWQRYLERYLTDENLKKFYEKNPRPFDGSEVRAAHLLLKVDPPQAGEALAAALTKAEQIREEIIAGKLTFGEAAERYSESPTAKSGGDLGFIRRHEPMPEPFSQAAFELEVGEISPPVVTPFGVHLIRAVEIKPGQRPWRLAEPEVRDAAMRYLFDWIANQQRGAAKIEFTGAMPHFKPGTQELAR